MTSDFLFQCTSGPAWWDLLPAATGAIIGATTAAIPSYLLARKSSKEVLERDMEARMEEKKSTAFNAMMKLFSITNGLASLVKHIDTCLAQSPPNTTPPLADWQLVTSLTGFVEEDLLFEPKELSIFVEGKNPDFSNRLWEISHRYIALDQSFQKYCDLREALGQKISAIDHGNFVSTRLTKEQLAKLTPQIIDLSSLIKSIKQSCKEDFDTAKTLCNQFTEKVNSSLEIKDFPTLKF